MKRLQYFFDPGSCVCLWATGESALEAYGYAVNHNDLPLSAETKACLTQLTARFDDSINWTNPTERGSRWTEVTEREFLEAADRGLRMVMDELGTAEFEVAARHRQDTNSNVKS